MNTLQCKQVSLAVEALQPLTAGQQAHADECPVCQTLLKQEMAMKDWLGSPVQPVPADFAQKVMSQVYDMPRVAHVKKASNNLVKAWLIPAAAAAVFVLIWVNSPMFTDNPVSNRLARMSQADDWVMAHIGPSDHDLLDHDPTEEMLSETVDF